MEDHSGRKPTFLFAMKVEDRIREIVERVANSEGMELVDVEYKGHGHASVVRIFLDKPGGVTHADCQLISRQVGAIIDVEDLIPTRYVLEVSSPGLDRKLLKESDYQRFSGKMVNLLLKVPRHGQKRYQGKLLGLEGSQVLLEMQGGETIHIKLSEVERTNLVVEF